MDFHRESIAAGHFSGTVVDELLTDAGISDAEAPHVLLATLWAAMVSPLPLQPQQKSLQHPQVQCACVSRCRCCTMLSLRHS